MVRSVHIVAVVALMIALLVGAGAVYAQGPGFGGRGRGGAFGPGAGMFRGLDLTEAQREQIQQITQEYREQVFAVLTPEQQQLVQKRRAAQETRMKERMERMQQRLQQRQPQ